MPILWNTSKADIETRFDGRTFRWSAGEKKKTYIPDEVNHITFKLQKYGLVNVPDDPTDEILKKYYISGLKARRKTMKDVVVQYQTANNERKAAKLGEIEPNEYEVKCVKEIHAIEAELREIDGVSKEDSALVKEYLNQGKVDQEEIDQTQEKIETDRAGGVKLKKQGSKPKREKQVAGAN